MLVTLMGTVSVVMTFALGVSSLSRAHDAAPGSTRQLTRKTFACIWFTVCGALVVSGLYLYVT
ncbi:hypothetical protein [Lentzea atacamensis]|uniref:hypothetical protein n=1 Tax=Lentzea atacamensis TaxID=531938 RepID=UPI001B882AB0|nr:hypothetical protein [Lentzea atacamensis]